MTALLDALSTAQQATIRRCAKRVLDLLPPAEGGTEAMPLHQGANVIGILGPRGAGKTTVLVETCDAIGKKPHGTDPPPMVLPVLDCSALPEEVAPTTGVLLHLHTHLQSEAKRADRKSLLEEPLNKLEELAGAPITLQREYRELCLELAQTQAAFQQSVTRGVRTSLDLNAALAKQLKDVAQKLRISAFVVPLDDFDLVSGRTHRAWIQAFLDPLRQPRLLFILTADLARLESLGPSEAHEVDDLTGRALLHQKVLPTQNQVALEPWGNAVDRRRFRPFGVSRDELHDVVQQAIAGTTIASQAPLLQALLPVRPRGLEHLYYSLQEARKRCEDGATPGGREILQILARARAEYFLAPRVAELAEDGWLAEFRWDERQADWRAAATCAAQAPGKGPDRGVLLALAPMRAVAPQHGPIERADGPPVESLRHDLARRDALRDAEGADRALWTELLLNLGLGQALRQRPRLLSAWPPMRTRLVEARLHVELSRDQLGDFFRDEEYVADLLPWFKWHEPAPAGDKLAGGQAQSVEDTRTLLLDIGWTPFQQALDGARRLWPARLLRSLYIPPSDLHSRVDSSALTNDQALAVLPATVRGLVLLVDALDRCPWEAIAAAHTTWRVTTYLRIAGALVRTAYVDALTRCRPARHALLGEAQQRWLSLMTPTEPGATAPPIFTALRQQEGDWLRSLNALDAEGTQAVLAEPSDGPVYSDEGALVEAAQAFFQSSAYLALAPQPGPR